MNPPKHAGELRPYKDTVYIYLPNRGWKPQFSVLNCNREQAWKLLTDKKLSKFHYLKSSQPDGSWIWDYEEKKFTAFTNS